MCVYLTVYCTAISNKQTSKEKKQKRKKKRKRLKQPLNKQGIEWIQSVKKKGSECYSEKWEPYIRFF